MPHPNLKYSRKNVDFDSSFYTTPIYEQAKNWCKKFKLRNKPGIISRYLFNENTYKELNVLFFDSYSERWLDFILSCRSGSDTSNYNIVVGGVANDKIFNTIELYLENLINKKEALGRLRYEKPNMQICFRTQKSIEDYLTYEGSQQI